MLCGTVHAYGCVIYKHVTLLYFIDLPVFPLKKSINVKVAVCCKIYNLFEHVDNSAIKHNLLIHVFRSSLKSCGKLIIVYTTMHYYDGMCNLSINYHDR